MAVLLTNRAYSLLHQHFRHDPEFCRRTGLTRSKARAIRKHGLGALPHGNSGRRAATTVPAGHTGLVDDLLGKGVTNSQVTCEKLVGQGYRGGLTSVKVYVAAHMDLVPAKRRAVAPQGSRGQRFRTGPGEAYQMDWGFVTVVGPGGTEHGIACFAMVCHHCSSPYVELFPNARQESLLIGMLHAYMAMGVPDEVPADSIKSVATGRDLDGRPVWQRDYSAFMGCVGFRTRLCRPRHPLAKGKVERLTRFARATSSPAATSPTSPRSTGRRCRGARSRPAGGGAPCPVCRPRGTRPLLAGASGSAPGPATSACAPPGSAA